MVKPHFKLDIFEILLFSRSQFFIIDRIPIFEATPGIKPTVLILFRVVLHLNEDANLSHDIISVAKIRALSIDTSIA